MNLKLARSALKTLAALVPGLVALRPAQAQNAPGALPPEAQSALSAGVAAAESQDYALAIRDFEAARKLAPQAAVIYYDLGAAYEKAGHPVWAIAWLSAYLAAVPDAKNATDVSLEVGNLKVSTQRQLDRIVQEAINGAGQLPGFQRTMAFESICFYLASRGDLDQALKLNPWPGNDGWVYSCYAGGLLDGGAWADETAVQDAMKHLSGFQPAKLDEYFMHSVRSGNFRRLQAALPHLQSYSNGADALLAAVEAELDNGDWEAALKWCDQMAPDPAVEAQEIEMAWPAGSAPPGWYNFSLSLAWPKHQALLEIALNRADAADWDNARELAGRILREPADPTGKALVVQNSQIDAEPLQEALNSMPDYGNAEFRDRDQNRQDSFLRMSLGAAEAILGNDGVARNIARQALANDFALDIIDSETIIGLIETEQGAPEEALKTAQEYAQNDDAWIPLVAYYLRAGDKPKALDAASHTEDETHGQLLKVIGGWTATTGELADALDHAVTGELTEPARFSHDWSDLDPRKLPSEADDWIDWVRDQEDNSDWVRDQEDSSSGNDAYSDDIAQRLRAISSEDATRIPGDLADLARQIYGNLLEIGQIQRAWSR